MLSFPVACPRPTRLTAFVCVLLLGSGLLSTIALSLATEVVTAQGSSGAVSFSQASYTVNEGDGRAQIRLTRTGGAVGQVTAKGRAGRRDHDPS